MANSVAVSTSMPLTSPLTAPPRRLSTRRSSACAPDPFNKSYRDDIQSTSTLTIVKVVQQQQPQPDFHHRPSSPQRGRSFRGRSRADQQQQQSQKDETSSSQRMTFAFNAFQPTQAGSPPSSPRLRPSSPHRHHSHRGLPQPRLGPEQLVDLAKTSIQSSQLPQNQKEPNLQPATFTPLPYNIYLPFIDRPAEVSTLISSHPSIKLFSLLSQTFPTPNNDVDPPTIATIPSNPHVWTYAQLYAHLTLSTRQEVPDDIWVLKARKAILAHSELIWERVKGALGVPPELDFDADLEGLEEWEKEQAAAAAAAAENEDEAKQTESPVEEKFTTTITTTAASPNPDPPLPSSRSVRSVRSVKSTSSIDTDDIPDDAGHPAHGHWDDWDAIMDSPLWARPKSRLAQDPSSPVFPSYGDYGLEGERPPSPSNLLVIEPLLVNPNAGGMSPGGTGPGGPPVASAHAGMLSSEITGVGLGDIQEGAEEEEEGGAGDMPVPPQGEDSNTNKEEEGLIAPQDIQGLRISTSPAFNPMSPSALQASVPLPHIPGVGIPIPHSGSGSSLNAQAVPSPISPLPPYYPGYGVSPSPSAIYSSNPFFTSSSATSAAPGATTSTGTGTSPIIAPQHPAQPKSRPGSFSLVGGFRRSGSFGSLGSLRELGNFSAGHLTNTSGIEDSGSERSFYSSYAGGGGGEGRGPRFPSSFAQARRRMGGAGAGAGEKNKVGGGGGDLKDAENAPLSFGIGIGRKPRTLSQSSTTSIPASTSVPLGGSVAGYKRLSWGVPAHTGASGLSVLAQSAEGGNGGSGTATPVTGSGSG